MNSFKDCKKLMITCFSCHTSNTVFVEKPVNITKVREKGFKCEDCGKNVFFSHAKDVSTL